MLPTVTLPPSVEERLARLAPDQRRAATAPPGPVLCVAPAGSGKTTTLVARVAWLVATGADPATICAITFNRRAAEELQSRVAVALAPLDLAPDAVRVKTFHALGREVCVTRARRSNRYWTGRLCSVAWRRASSRQSCADWTTPSAGSSSTSA